MGNRKILILTILVVFMGISLFAESNENKDENKIIKKLKSTKISVDFKNSDIQDVIKILSDKSDVNMVANKEVDSKITVKLKNLTIMRVIDIICDTHMLNYVIEPDIIKFFSKGQYMSEGVFFGAESRAYYLKHSKAEDIKKKLEEIGLGKAEKGALELVKMYPDDRLNALIVIGKKEILDKINIENIIDSFDKPTPQVLIEAKILSINLAEDNMYGIDWNSILANIQIDIPGAFTSKGGFTPLSLSIEQLLGKISENNDVNVLSSPRLVIANGEEAKIIEGSSLPYPETQFNPESRMTTTSYKFMDVGMGMTVTPQINKKNITLKIKPEISQALTLKSDAAPQKSMSELETTVTVEDGQSLILGGLFRAETTKSVRRVPILGYIPIIRWLFSTGGKHKIKQEIVFLIKTTILKGDEDFSAIYNSLESKIEIKTRKEKREEKRRKKKYKREREKEEKKKAKEKKKLD